MRIWAKASVDNDDSSIEWFSIKYGLISNVWLVKKILNIVYEFKANLQILKFASFYYKF